MLRESIELRIPSEIIIIQRRGGAGGRWNSKITERIDVFYIRAIVNLALNIRFTNIKKIKK